MRIAYISDTYLPETDGVVTAIVRHIRLLADRGHEFLVLCPSYSDTQPDGERRITVDRFFSVGVASNSATRFAFPSYPGMVKRLAEFEPDIVHVHTPLLLGLTGIASARHLEVPLVQTYHSWVPAFMQYATPSRMFGYDRGPRPTRDGAAARAFTHWVYDHSDLVLAPSEALCEVLREMHLRPEVRYQTNGIDLTEFPPKTEWSKRRRIMHCGRLGYEKNAEVVVEAFTRFRATHPDWKLHILGEGPARPYLQQLIDRLGVRESVEFDGFVTRERLAQAYRDSDIYATASTIETQGLVVLEAMASGTPVVGVNALALPEMARNGVSGIIVQPYDPAAMASAFATLADDDDLREQFGTACLKEVRSHELHCAVDRLEETYRELAARCRLH